MSRPRAYGLIVGLSIAAAAGVETASSAGRHAVAVASEETWTIPGAGRTPGQNNTFFVSDLALTNLGSATANVTISFVGPGGLPAKPISLAAGATTVYRDVLNSLWSATGLVGAISVHADQPLVLRARTYNTAATGTFGVSLPVYSSSQLLEEAQIADSIWIQHHASGASGFRTNVGVVFPDETGGEAVVTFYDAGAAVAGTLRYSSAAAGFQQQSVASAAPAGLPVGRAQIQVTRGHAAGYAVGVDNITGDTSLYPLEALPAGVQDVVVSGVARLTGRNDTFFRTDARLYNRTPDDVTVTVRFHAAGAANPTPSSATVTVPGGRIIEVVDVLGSILNAPVGSGGAVRFTADAPVAILCRTSNVDPQGVQPGTFGAQQRAVPVASFLSSADAGAVVTAIRQDASFRTNVGFAAGPDGAAYLLTLKNAQGAAVAVTTGSLGSFGWAQPSIADLFPGTTIPADATLLVQVTSGTLDVYDASLDNASGDLVVTPIAPVPAALPTFASIGPAGGSIRSADGRLTLKVPAGALAAPTTLSIEPIANTAPNAIGTAYRLTPVGLSFARPAQLVLAYSTEDLDGTGEGALGLASEDGSNWLGISGGSVDPVARTLSVPVGSTSPAAASARSDRSPQRVSAPTGSLGPYGAVRIIPGGASIPLGTTKDFLVTTVGQSSTQSRTPGVLPIGGIWEIITTWSVNGIVHGNSVEGTVASASPGEGLYTAPRCKPLINPVWIGVNVRLQGTGVWTNIGARVRLVENDWYIQVLYQSEARCSTLAPANFEFVYGRSREGTFRLDENGVHSFTPTGNIADFTDPPEWCPGSGYEHCTQPVPEPIGQLQLLSLAGVFGETFRPSFVLTVNARIPGYNAKVNFFCTADRTVPASLPIAHGAPQESLQTFLLEYPGFQQVRTYPFPGSIEYAAAYIEPIEPSGCP